MKRSEIPQRNESIINDYKHGSPTKELAKKYDLTESAICRLTKGTIRDVIREDIVLPPRLEALRLKYKNFELVNEVVNTRISM